MKTPGSVPCTECQSPVLLVPRGWAAGDPIYCTDHAALLHRDPRFVIPDAIRAAERDMMQPASELVDWCVPSLTETLGYLLPGTVSYAAAFPKNGKTAFLANNLAYWDRIGVRVWVMPTESRPKGLMTRMACFRAGVSPDEAMSRRLRVRMEAGDPEAFDQLTRLMVEFSRMQQQHRDDGSNIAIEPAPRLTRALFRRSVQAAAAGGYQLVVCDHVDHVGGDADSGESGYASSEGVQHDALEFAEHFEIPVLLMTQLNTSRVKGDPLYRYKRPVTDWVWMKGVKDMIASTMFGIYRPMQSDVDDKLLQAVKQQETESWRIARPNTMGIADMLSRYNGAKPDQTLFLHYADGLISEQDQGEAWERGAHVHGIHTGSPSGRGRGRAA